MCGYAYIKGAWTEGYTSKFNGATEKNLRPDWYLGLWNRIGIKKPKKSNPPASSTRHCPGFITETLLWVDTPIQLFKLFKSSNFPKPDFLAAHSCSNSSKRLSGSSIPGGLEWGDAVSTKTADMGKIRCSCCGAPLGRCYLQFLSVSFPFTRPDSQRCSSGCFWRVVLAVLDTWVNQPGHEKKDERGLHLPS